MLAMDEQVQMMNIEEKRMVAEPIEVLEDISLDEKNLERCTRVGADLEEKTTKDLIHFLRKSIDVFAWSHEDMLGIDPSVISHRLNLLSLCDKRKWCLLLRETMLLKKRCRS